MDLCILFIACFSVELLLFVLDSNYSITGLATTMAATAS